MPPSKPVHTLRSFAKDKVLYNACAVILDEIYFGQDDKWEVHSPSLSVRLGVVRDVLTGALTPSLLEDILNTILSRDEAVEAVVRFIAIQLLLVEGVRCLSVGNFPEAYHTLVLHAVAKHGTGIHQLDLRGLWVKGEHKNALMRVLRKLPDIRRLTLRYTCDDDMLATLGKYAENLQKLDITGSQAVTEEGLRKLCNYPTRVVMGSLSDSLQIVDLGGPGSKGLAPSHISYLLLHLPHLVSLGSYEHAGAAVDLALQSRPGKKFGLRYMHDTITPYKRFLSVVSACPHLTAIYFDSPKDKVVHNLGELKELIEIKMNKVRWSDTVILLQQIGRRLRSLFLLSVFGELDLLELGVMCPRLLRLELHNTALHCSADSHASAFQQVRELFVYTSPLSVTCVKLLLTQCVAVEHFSLGDCGHLTDGVLHASLIQHALRHVRHIWFGVAEHLTVQSVQALLDHCPELLSLGNLAAWDLRPEHIDLLRVQVFITNRDLTLHEVGSQFSEDEWIPIVVI
ncbi:uncharacterized protein LOC126996890 [Eriocheir sinensis]|uniref:uncharacterized protein LOC126996890 n=1 Tax=Eriocheir sinensis TaxID=95602 RepID=UPI0021C9AFAF|nr:uncharacterized protein LOC126996890 [Eriocheir sinensis]